MTAPSAGQVERFRADLLDVWPLEDRTPEHDGTHLGLAVSGGADSLALLLLAHAALPGRIVVASVDHQLRPESADEVELVAGICADLGIPCHRLTVNLGTGNLQDRARRARYDAMFAALAAENIGAIATAHHADDQAETLLMRLNRGAGLQGLAGVRPRSWYGVNDPPLEGILVRPLLGWRRAELAQIVSGAGLAPARDPSNEDEHYDRVRIRKAIAEADWLDPLAMAHSARHLADAEYAIRETAISVRNRFTFRQGDGSVYFHWGHPDLIEIEVVRMILKDFGAAPDRSAVARMTAQLKAGKAASLGGVLAKRAMHHKDASTSCDAWHFQTEPPRKAGEF
ncbi:tRNA lysidine(34) synthetase TilS [Qipengyuania sp. DSG2-2]|uniref:tRNA lysidine(34) synthetase TilS n=1 Tax=Qipengyuania sp. DGS2-2 TaxID=3349631 RepID=UPI0036D28D35